MSEINSKKRKMPVKFRDDLKRCRRHENHEVTKVRQINEAKKGIHMLRKAFDSNDVKAERFSSESSPMTSSNTNPERSLGTSSSNDSDDDLEASDEEDRSRDAHSAVVRAKDQQRADIAQRRMGMSNHGEAATRKSQLNGITSESPLAIERNGQEIYVEEAYDKITTSPSSESDTSTLEHSIENESKDSQREELSPTHRDSLETARITTTTSNEEGTETSTSETTSDGSDGSDCSQSRSPTNPIRKRRLVESSESSISFSSGISSDSSASPRPSPFASPDILDLHAHSLKPPINRPSTSNLGQRLASFLPQLQRANAALTAEDTQQLDDVDDDEERYIEMNLGLGVLEGGKEPRRSMDGIQLEPENDTSSASSDEGVEGLPREGILESMMGRKGASKDRTAVREVA